jgi:N-acetylmuramoyl-L-alanine amidase
VYLISALILFFALPLSAAFRVVLDPGHGGSDLGAIRDSFVESKIVLQIAQKIKSILEKHPGITVELTREKNQSVSLKDRVNFANSSGAELFVSLHANTSNSDSVTGMEFYFNSPKLPATPGTVQKNPDAHRVLEKIKNDFSHYRKTEKSLSLSQTIFSKTSQNQKAVIRRAPFYVIENTSMPSVLIEVGFISNRRDAKKLTSEEYQNELAALIAQSIADYKEKSDKIHPL